MKTNNKIIIFLLIFLLFSINLYSQDTIRKLDNNIFAMPDVNYIFSENQEPNTEINENFFREIINGNIFTLFNWLNYFTIEKNNKTIKIKTSHTQHKGEVSRNFISLFISCFNRLIDNRIEIIYQEAVTINYKIEKNNTNIHIRNIRNYYTQ